MESNLLERLKQKTTRQSVPPREEKFALSESVSEENIPTNKNSAQEFEPDFNLLQKKEVSLEEEKNNALPSIAKKGRLIRLENDLQEELLSLCHQEGITLELFVEAAFVNIQRNEKLLRRVLLEANERQQRRKQASLVRRARTLSQKYDS